MRGPRSNKEHLLANSLPSSARSSPQNYFVPTMVNHHSIFGNSLTNNDASGIQSRDLSPVNNSNDEFSDYGGGPFEGGSFQQK